MVYKGFLLLPLIFGLGVAPVLAHTTVIAELGSAPLLGTSASTAEMRERVARNEGIVSAAAFKLGLTTAEYAQFRTAIAESRVAWVTLPRHLDAMSWQSAEKVYVLRDVRIPAGTNGWEVDVRSQGKILSLYMPAKCGNLSLVRKAAPLVAHRPPIVTRVAALKVEPPAEAVPPAVVAAAPPDDTPAPAPVVAQAEFPPAPVATHHSALFLAPLLFGLAALSGGVGPSPAILPSGCP